MASFNQQLLWRDLISCTVLVYCYSTKHFIQYRVFHMEFHKIKGVLWLQIFDHMWLVHNVVINLCLFLFIKLLSKMEKETKAEKKTKGGKENSSSPILYISNFWEKEISSPILYDVICIGYPRESWGILGNPRES